MYFRFLVNNIIGKGQGPSFEQTWIPFTQGWFVPGLVKIDPVNLEKNAFKFRQCIFAILLLSPFGRGWFFYLNKLEYPSPKGVSCLVWSKLAQWFWRRRWKCEKLTDRRTDKRRSEKFTWAFSPGEIKHKPLHWIQNSLNYLYKWHSILSSN